MKRPSGAKYIGIVTMVLLGIVLFQVPGRRFILCKVWNQASPGFPAGSPKDIYPLSKFQAALPPSTPADHNAGHTPGICLAAMVESPVQTTTPLPTPPVVSSPAFCVWLLPSQRAPPALA